MAKWNILTNSKIEIRISRLRTFWWKLFSGNFIFLRHFLKSLDQNHLKNLKNIKNEVLIKRMIKTAKWNILLDSKIEIRISRLRTFRWKFFSENFIFLKSFFKSLDLNHLKNLKNIKNEVLTKRMIKMAKWNILTDSKIEIRISRLRTFRWKFLVKILSF